MEIDNSTNPLDLTSRTFDEVNSMTRRQPVSYKSGSSRTPIEPDFSSSLWLKKGVFHPESFVVMGWDLVSFFFILFEAITVPYYLGFDLTVTGSLVSVEFAITVFFLVDIFVSFNKGYYGLGALVMNRKLIAKHYIKTWFFLDFLASFPVIWFIDGPFAISSSNGSSSAQSGQSSTGSSYIAPKLLRLFKILRFLRLLRLVRLAKLSKILTAFEDTISNNAFASLVVYTRLLGGIFYLAHWTACIWYYISDQEASYNTWTKAAYISDEKSQFNDYVAALYWAFTTMSTVGYGDIVPVTTNEKVFTMFTMLLACGTFAYTLASVSSLILKNGLEENEYRLMMIKTTRFMSSNNIPSDLQFKVTRYLECVRENAKKRSILDQEVMDVLSEPLKDEVYSQIHAKIFKVCPVFEIFQPELISGLTKKLTYATYAPNDVIFEEGMAGRQLFFVKSGEVLILHKSSNTNFIKVKPGGYFGEIGFFTRLLRTASVRCLDFVLLMSLDRKAFNEIACKYPDAEMQADLLSTKCSKGNLSSLGVVCYVCRQVGHVAIQCRGISLNIKGQDMRRAWLDSRKLQSKRIRITSPMTLRPSRKSLLKKRFIDAKEPFHDDTFSSLAVLSAKVKSFVSEPSTGPTSATPVLAENSRSRVDIYLDSDKED